MKARLTSMAIVAVLAAVSVVGCSNSSTTAPTESIVASGTPVTPDTLASRSATPSPTVIAPPETMSPSPTSTEPTGPPSISPSDNADLTPYFVYYFREQTDKDLKSYCAYYFEKPSRTINSYVNAWVDTTEALGETPGENGLPTLKQIKTQFHLFVENKCNKAGYK